MEDGWTPNLTLESNEYQSYMLKCASNVVQKLCDLLGGRGGSPKDHRGSRSQEGGGIKKIGQIEGAHKDNNYSQDQISVGDSGGDIFIDQH